MPRPLTGAEHVLNWQRGVDHTEKLTMGQVAEAVLSGKARRWWLP